MSQAIREGNLVVASVLSGNRNFEGRIQQEVRANYLASPPLVVAYALAGTMDIDLLREPLGHGKDGAAGVPARHLADAGADRGDGARVGRSPRCSESKYRYVFEGEEDWRNLDVPQGELFAWDPDSTYIKQPPYFDGMTMRARHRHGDVEARACWRCSATR